MIHVVCKEQWSFFSSSSLAYTFLSLSLSLQVTYAFFVLPLTNDIITQHSETTPPESLDFISFCSYHTDKV